MARIGTATVYLLVAIVLGCPYDCLANAALSAAGPATRVHRTGGCDCCGKRQPDRTPCPGRPDSSPSGGACLCRGAVVDRQVEAPPLNQAVIWLLPPEATVLVRPLPAVLRGASLQYTACHFAAADSGREVRALIASLVL